MKETDFNRTCMECRYAKISGKYIPETRIDPAEYPEFDYCMLGEIDTISEKYFELTKKFHSLLEKQGEVSVTLDWIQASFCDHYEEIDKEAGFDGEEF